MSARYIKYIIIIIIVFASCGCDGIIANHYASRENQPLDGSIIGNKISSSTAKYPQGNLDYLTDIRTRNNKTYFASARMYNENNHLIASEYVKNYKKYLKVDAKELENGLKNRQYGVPGAALLQKMEAGTLQSYPLAGNIVVMQDLNDKENKIAFPDYMDEYMDVYTSNTKQEKQKKTLVQENNNDFLLQNNGKTPRDRYVNKFLAWNDGYSINNKEAYKEQPLDW